MLDRPRVSDREIDEYHIKLKNDTESGGYNLNPDTEFTRDLIEGLIVNEKRYGYPACPCRASTGIKEEDLDIICPCDYRDPDLEEHHACFCGLYVSKWAIENKYNIRSIPERRPLKNDRAVRSGAKSEKIEISVPIWRCKVCGYLCARDKPPEICPICKVKRDRFERFIG